MRPFAAIETAIEAATRESEPRRGARALLGLAEEILEHWVVARGFEPTQGEREGFRLLALHRQGATRDPSFNACRETCREVAYHYNLITLEPCAEKDRQRLLLMGLVVNHLALFISGKMQVAELGEFCCSSSPIRTGSETERSTTMKGA